MKNEYLKHFLMNVDNVLFSNSSHVLDTKKNEREHVARVYSTTLMREVFQTLGLQRNVEATVRIIFISLIKIKFSIYYPVFN